MPLKVAPWLGHPRERNMQFLRMRHIPGLEALFNLVFYCFASMFDFPFLNHFRSGENQEALLVRLERDGLTHSCLSKLL